MRISNVAAIAAVDALTALLNTGGAGSIQIYDGAQPASVETAVTTQNLLATVTLSVDAFGDAVDITDAARATANAIASGTAIAAGTVTWFRAFDGSGTAIIDGTAGTTGVELVLDDDTFEVNDNVDVSSWTISIAE